MKKSNVFFGMLGAAAIGVLVGIMVAPDKGSKTRKKIKEKGGDLANKLMEKVKQGDAKAREILNTILDQKENLAEEVQDSAQKIKNSLS